ncbi:MAG: hypothetical protein RLZZ312_1040 [Bacteroidota bacterium]
MNSTFLSIILVITNLFLWGQEHKPTSMQFSGYVETYFVYDFADPASHERPSFVYNHNRHNELNINLAFAKANYVKYNVRANFALMTGTYAQYNLAGEQALLRNVFEANVGVKISKTHNLWIDAGIMPAHIGFESAIGRDNATLTRSILADNSPYFEAGAKIGYTSPSEKWYLAAMYLNGWQRIQKINGNQTPAFGTQITYKPSAKTTLNWSTFAGNEFPDVDRKWRYFHNLFGQFKLSSKTNLTAGFDIGSQQSAYKSDQYDIWYSPVLILQHKPTNKIQLAVRGEYYEDSKRVIIASGTPNGFRAYGFSANFDYLIADNVMFRVEARNFSGNSVTFIDNSTITSYNTFVSSALAISF